MYARLLIESLRRGTRRKLLAVTAVALGTLGATALGEVMLASGDRLASELASYGANLELVPGPGSATLAAARLPLVRRIFWRNNIAALAPLYPLRLRLSVDPRDEAAATAAAPVIAEVEGTWFHYPLEPDWRTGLPATRPTLRLAGRWPRDEPAVAAGGPAEIPRPAEAVRGRRLAALLRLGIGGRLRAALGARSAPLAVTGIVTSGGEEDDQAFVPLADPPWRSRGSSPAAAEG